MRLKLLEEQLSLADILRFRSLAERGSDSGLAERQGSHNSADGGHAERQVPNCTVTHCGSSLQAKKRSSKTERKEIEPAHSG